MYLIVRQHCIEFLMLQTVIQTACKKYFIQIKSFFSCFKVFFLLFLKQEIFIKNHYSSSKILKGL